MRYKRAHIDSLCLSGLQVEAVFIHNPNYEIEIVKSKVVFLPKVWRDAFRKTLQRCQIEAKIIHTHLGLMLPLKTYSRTPLSQTVEFAGLHGYNERSQLLQQTLKELSSQLKPMTISRVDVAIDYSEKIPKKIVDQLLKIREPFVYGNTTYYKTSKEKKTNLYMDVKIYDKKRQAGMKDPLMRLEFCFKGSYFKDVQFKDLIRVKKKMEKSIKKATGLSVIIK